MSSLRRVVFAAIIAVFAVPALEAMSLAGEPIVGKSIVITRKLTTTTTSSGSTASWKVTIKCGSGSTREISMGEYLDKYSDALQKAESSARSHRNTTSAKTTVEWVSNYNATTKTEVDTITSTTSFVGTCE